MTLHPSITIHENRPKRPAQYNLLTHSKVLKKTLLLMFICSCGLQSLENTVGHLPISWASYFIQRVLSLPVRSVSIILDWLTIGVQIFSGGCCWEFSGLFRVRA